MIEKRYFDILKNLISIDTSNINNNNRFCNYIYNYCKQFDVDIKLLKSNYCNAKSIIVEPKYINETVDFVFSGHSDVVSVKGQNWDYNPFKLNIINGFAYGRGVVDMKGFLACILYKLKDFLDKKLKFLFVITYDEETNVNSIKEICDYLKKYKINKLAIIGEPSSCNIKNLHKGDFDIKVEIFGKSFHSSEPSKGVNAIEIGARIINFIEKCKKKLKDKTVTTSIGVINGGTAVNIVPDYCKFCFDIRFYNLNIACNLLKQIQYFCKKLILQKKCKIKIEKICEILSLNNSIDNKNAEFMGCTEAGFYQQLGVPSVIFGLGDFAEAHRENEKLEIKQINHYLKKLDGLINKYLIQE